MFEIKYFLDGIELKTGMKVKCSCCGSYGDIVDIYPIVIKNNKLYIQTPKKVLWEVDDCLTRVLEIIL